MQQDWNIKSRSEVCEITGRPFVEGEAFHTALIMDGEGFRRIDLCEEAWKARLEDATAEPLFSSWRSKFEPPAPPTPEPLPRDDVEGMLRRLMESQDPAHTNTRYLLAVMLERKRILRPQSSPDKGTLIYERAGTGETFIIADPNLSLSDLVAVQEEVTSLLSGLTSISGEPAADSSESEEIKTAGEHPSASTAEAA